MARKKENIVVIVAQFPWWVGLLFAAVTYVALKYWFPIYAADHLVLKGVAQGLSHFAWFFSGLFVLSACISAFNAWRKGELFDSQTSLSSIKNISWQEFEELVGEYYRRRGFSVTETGKGGADGGVDLVLIKNGVRILVQCKQYRVQKVGVSVVRELYGVMAAEDAQRGIVVTTGVYTPDAMRFAAGKALELLDGDHIVRMFGSVQKEPSLKVTSPEKVICPKCSSQMVLRKARSGANAGKSFWGCSQYPRCRGIRSD